MPMRVGQVWIGQYLCRNRRAWVQLEIRSVSSRKIAAVKTYKYKYQGSRGRGRNSRVGKMYMHGTYRPVAREMYFKPGKWIDQPGGHFGVAWRGRFTAQGARYQGKIDHRTCGKFTVDLKSKPIGGEATDEPAVTNTADSP